MFFLKHLTSFLQNVGHLAVGAFACYSMLNTLPLFFEKQKYIIKAIKVVLELFKLANQSCNM